MIRANFLIHKNTCDGISRKQFKKNTETKGNQHSTEKKFNARQKQRRTGAKTKREIKRTVGPDTKQKQPTDNQRGEVFQITNRK